MSILDSGIFICLFKGWLWRTIENSRLPAATTASLSSFLTSTAASSMMYTLSLQVLNWTLDIDMAIEHHDKVVDGRENVVHDKDLWWGLNNGGWLLMDNHTAVQFMSRGSQWSFSYKNMDAWLSYMHTCNQVQSGRKQATYNSTKMVIK